MGLDDIIDGALIGWDDRAVASLLTAYQQDPNEQNLHILMLACCRCGDSSFAERDYEAAQSAYQYAADLGEQFEQLQTSILIRRDLSDCYGKTGDACREQFHIASSGLFYEKAMRLRQSAAEQTGTVEDCQALCLYCEKTAGVHRAIKRLSDAKACFEKSLRLRRWIVEKDPADHHRRALAAVFGFLGDLHRDSNDYPAANACYQEELRLCQQLVADSDTHPNREVLALSHYKVATTFAKEQHGERQTHLQKSYALFTQLSKEAPQVLRFQNIRNDIRAHLSEY